MPFADLHKAPAESVSRARLTKGKVAVPRLGGGRMGVFATRSPHRPSPIGLSVAKVCDLMVYMCHPHGGMYVGLPWQVSALPRCIRLMSACLSAVCA